MGCRGVNVNEYGRPNKKMNTTVAFEALIFGWSKYCDFEQFTVSTVMMMNSRQKRSDAVMKIILRSMRPAMNNAAMVAHKYDSVLRIAL